MSLEASFSRPNSNINDLRVQVMISKKIKGMNKETPYPEEYKDLQLDLSGSADCDLQRSKGSRRQWVRSGMFSNSNRKKPTALGQRQQQIKHGILVRDINPQYHG